MIIWKVEGRKPMITRGKREGARRGLVWGGRELGRRGSVVCVWCGKISVQVWGEVCVYAAQCVTPAKLGFTLLTSHTFPPVTKCKYIQREMHSHLPCIGMSSLCPVYNLYALYRKQLHALSVSSVCWCISCTLLGRILFRKNYLQRFCNRWLLILPSTLLC